MGQRTDGTAPATLTVDELMTADVITINPDDTIGRARDLMLGLGIHGLPVLDEFDDVIGIVTSSDLVEEWPSAEPVETMMSRHLLTIDVEASIAEAAEFMIAERVHHLLVARDSRPAGILSAFDLLRALSDEEGS